MFDWTFVTHYAPFFVSGAEMTLFISVFGIVLSIVVGLICASIEIARIPVLKQIVRVYIELSRNTPLLVQLYFLYFGLPKLGVVWSAEQCAIVGLGFLGGSYMAEAYYSTYESLLMLVVAYLVILLPISLFGTWLERRFDYERR